MNNICERYQCPFEGGVLPDPDAFQDDHDVDDDPDLLAAGRQVRMFLLIGLMRNFSDSYFTRATFTLYKDVGTTIKTLCKQARLYIYITD